MDDLKIEPSNYIVGLISEDRPIILLNELQPSTRPMSFWRVGAGEPNSHPARDADSAFP